MDDLVPFHRGVDPSFLDSHLADEKGEADAEYESSDVGEETHVPEVRDTEERPDAHRERELADRPQTEHQPRGRREGALVDADHPHEVDKGETAVPEADGKGAHHPGDGPRGADQRLVEIRVSRHEDEGGRGPGQKIESDKERAAPDILHGRSDEVEEEEIAEQVEQTGVDELMGEQGGRVEIGRHEAPSPERLHVAGREVGRNAFVQLCLLTPQEITVGRRVGVRFHLLTQ